MLEGANIRFSDAWWLQRLESLLLRRRDGEPTYARSAERREGRRPLTELDSYLRGDPPLPPAVGGWGDVMRGYYRMARINLAELTVDTPASKLRVLGFRTAADNDVNGDERAAKIYTANQLNVALAEAFSWMLAFGDSYLMVGPPLESEPDIPVITPEHPFEVITSDDPRTGLPRAALKLFRDADFEEDRAYVYLPGYCRVAVRSIHSSGFGALEWNWDDNLSFVYPDEMKDVVPVRRLQNRRGLGEFEPHLDLLDHINETMFDTLTVSKYQSYRKYVVSGVPSVDTEGNPIDYGTVFSASPGDITVIGDPGDGDPLNVKVWESSTTDMNPMRQKVQDLIRILAAATSTPLHLVQPDAAQGSAAGAALQKEGGSWKADNRRERAEHQLAQIMALAFRFLGDADRTDVTKISTIWAPSERYSLAERADAAVKAKAADLPWATRAQDIWQYSPEEIDRMEQQRADDALLAAPTPAERTAATAAAGGGAAPGTPASLGQGSGTAQQSAVNTGGAGA